MYFKNKEYINANGVIIKTDKFWANRMVQTTEEGIVSTNIFSRIDGSFLYNSTVDKSGETITIPIMNKVTGFIEKEEISNGITNTYSFDNIGRLMSIISSDNNKKLMNEYIDDDSFSICNTIIIENGVEKYISAFTRLDNDDINKSLETVVYEDHIIRYNKDHTIINIYDNFIGCVRQLTYEETEIMSDFIIFSATINDNIDYIYEDGRVITIKTNYYKGLFGFFHRIYDTLKGINKYTRKEIPK